MAQVGDVLITARADVGQAKQAFRSLQADVKLAGADFRAGALSIGDYRQALASARQSAMGLRSAGLAPMGAELGAFNQVLVATGPRLENARRGLGTVRTAMVGLAASTVGARGPLTSLSSGLLLFGAGSAVGTGIAAGLVAIALAFDKIREKSKAAKEAVRDAVADWEALPWNRRVAVGIELADFRTQLAENQARLVGQRQALADIDPLDPQRFAIKQTTLTSIARLEAQTIDLGKSIAARTLEFNELGQQGKDAGDKVRNSWEGTAAIIKSAMAEVHRQVTASRESIQQAIDLREAAAQGRITESLFRAGPMGTRGKFSKAELKAEFDSLGELASMAFTRGFVRSAFDGFKGFGSMLKNVFASLFEDALLQAMRRVGRGGGGGGLFGFLANVGIGFATGGPAGAAAGAGKSAFDTFGKASQSRAGPVFNVGPPRSPTDLSRDASWIAAVSETLLNMESGGFRLARRP